VLALVLPSSTCAVLCVVYGGVKTLHVPIVDSVRRSLRNSCSRFPFGCLEAARRLQLAKCRAAADRSHAPHLSLRFWVDLPHRDGGAWRSGFEDKRKQLVIGREGVKQFL
jgi:hypothetical protein